MAVAIRTVEAAPRVSEGLLGRYQAGVAVGELRSDRRSTCYVGIDQLSALVYVERKEPDVRRSHRRGKEVRGLRPLSEAIADTDQEKLRLLKVQEQVASHHSNYEWAAVLRDEQLRLLGSEHPQAPQLGPGLNLDQVVDTLTDIENTLATLRAGTPQDAARSAGPGHGFSMADVEQKIALLRAESSRVAAMSAAAAAEAAAETEV